jgi:hypothetical protein
VVALAVVVDDAVVVVDVVVVGAVVVAGAVVVVVVLAGWELAVDVVPDEAAGVPFALPHAASAVAASAAAASSSGIRFMRRCSGIPVTGPSPGFRTPWCVPVSGRRHGP